MGLGLGLGIAAGVGALGSNVLGTILNYKSQNKWAEKNFDQQERMFEYQKYLNNNQMQIQAGDAQAAGINPLAMSGGSLSGGSYSNVASPEVDTSGIANALSQLASLKNERDIANKHNETQTDIASNQVEAQKYATDKDYEARQAQIKSQQQIAMEKIASEERIALGKRTSDESIASANRLSSEKIASANRQSNENISARRLNFDKKVAIADSARKNHITEQEVQSRYIKDRNEAYEAYLKLKAGVPIGGAGIFTPIYSFILRMYDHVNDFVNKVSGGPEGYDRAFERWFDEHYDFKNLKLKDLDFSNHKGGR